MTLFLIILFSWLSFGGIVYTTLTSKTFFDDIVECLKKDPDCKTFPESYIRYALLSKTFLITCLLLALPLSFIIIPIALIKYLKGEQDDSK